MDRALQPERQATSASGTVSDVRLSGNVDLLNMVQTIHRQQDVHWPSWDRRPGSHLSTYSVHVDGN